MATRPGLLEPKHQNSHQPDTKKPTLFHSFHTQLYRELMQSRINAMHSNSTSLILSRGRKINIATALEIFSAAPYKSLNLQDRYLITNQAID